MKFGFEGIGKKKEEKRELTVEDTKLFEKLYGVDNETVFNDDVENIASDLRDRMQDKPVDEEKYINTLRSIKDFAEDSAGLSLADLNVIEILVSKLEIMKDTANEENLQAYLANSPLKGVL